MNPPVLEARAIEVRFPLRKGWLAEQKHVHAVDGVSLSVAKGETLSIVGESGCGKSTVGRALLRLVDLSGGQVWLQGQRIDTLSPAALRPLRRGLQVVFQDPFASLNPRLRIGEILAEPIRNFEPGLAAAQVQARVKRLLDLVRLPPDCAQRLAHEFSGGQRQRICIARALASNPEVLVCDEAVSALDVSVKAQIVNLLRDLQRDLGLAIVFISHDLAIVEHLTHRIAVMYLGRIVEQGRTDQIFGHARHPYSRALLGAVPGARPGTRRTVLTGDVPSPMDRPSGCHFRTRCPHAFERCAVEAPALRDHGQGQLAACHLDHVPD